MKVDDVHVNFIIKCLKQFVKILPTDQSDTAPSEKIASPPINLPDKPALDLNPNPSKTQLSIKLEPLMSNLKLLHKLSITQKRVPTSNLLIPCSSPKRKSKINKKTHSRHAKSRLNLPTLIIAFCKRTVPSSPCWTPSTGPTPTSQYL